MYGEKKHDKNSEVAESTFNSGLNIETAAVACATLALWLIYFEARQMLRGGGDFIGREV